MRFFRKKNIIKSDINIIFNNIAHIRFLEMKKGVPMGKNFMEIIMNPVRQRIMQFLLVHQKGTAKEMMQELTDIPSASLYRHIRILHEAGCIKVVEERKIRGTTEKTYQLEEQPMGDPGPEEIAALFQTGLLSLMTSFQAYFAREDADPKKDMLSLSTSTLLLNEEEFMDMMQKIGTIFSEVISNKPGQGRKPRRFTIISSPCETDHK